MAKLDGATSSNYAQYNPPHAADKALGTSNIGRMLPRQVSTGQMRGTQGVGIRGAKIDASNNQIVLGASDGSSVGIGAIPGFSNEVGFFTVNPQGKLTYKLVNGVAYYYDDDGNLVVKIENGTIFTFDAATGLNTVQMGRLPNSTGGVAGANQGFSVADGFDA